MGNRKIAFILLGATFVVLSLILLVYLKVRFSAETARDISVVPTPVIVEDLITWVDQSGFTFQYPKSLNLDPHEEDEDNYAHLELTSATYSGNLIIWAKDTTSEDTDAWIKNEKIKGAINSTLGGEKAAKLLSADGLKKLILTAIRGGYLYQIETNSTDSYWNKVYETVSSSFKFTEKEEQAQDDDSYQDTTIDETTGGTFDEEEIIE